MLEARNIFVEYGDRMAVRDVSFELPDGKILALLGPNGAGKTTVVRVLNGSVTQVKGSVVLDGRDVRHMSRREIAANIAVVAQENETRFPVTVLEFVLAGRFVHGGAFGWETGADMDYAEKALTSCDLAAYEHRQMNELSGGERQRVVLARAIATNAQILLLDEPTANLDLAHQAMMFRLLRALCDERGVSAVVITHDLNLAAAFADEIIMLNHGRIAAKGASADVLTAENVREVFGVEVLLDTHPSNRSVRITAVF